jgi:flagellar biosynthesis/type III secretory pathway protein FliH
MNEKKTKEQNSNFKQDQRERLAEEMQIGTEPQANKAAQDMREKWQAVVAEFQNRKFESYEAATSAIIDAVFQQSPLLESKEARHFLKNLLMNDELVEEELRGLIQINK